MYNWRFYIGLGSIPPWGTLLGKIFNANTTIQAYGVLVQFICLLFAIWALVRVIKEYHSLGGN